MTTPQYNPPAGLAQKQAFLGLYATVQKRFFSTSSVVVEEIDPADVPRQTPARK